MLKRNKDKLITLPIGIIHPNQFQPRQTFEQSELNALCESIKRNGLLQPVTVRYRDDGCYELIAGERRLRACRMAGLTKIPCILKNVDDRKGALFGLIENIQRQDLSFFEEAEGLQRILTEWGITQTELAQRLGRSPSTIANKLRLLRLTAEQRARITASGLGERHARALLRIDEEPLRSSALNEMIIKQMTSSQAEKYVTDLLSPPEPKKGVHTSIIGDMRVYVNTLTKAVDSIRRLGLDAKSDSTETETYIEYRVIIPKNTY